MWILFFVFGGWAITLQDASQSIADTKSLSEEEKGYLLECFRALNIREDELRYEKKWATDTIFRLERVEDLLDNPLSVPGYVDSVCDFLTQPLPKLVGRYMSLWLQLAVKFSKEAGLGYKPREIARLEKEIESEILGEPSPPLRPLPSRNPDSVGIGEPGRGAAFSHHLSSQSTRVEGVPAFFSPLIGAFRVAGQYLEVGLKDLKREELDKILMYTPALWGSDSVDARNKGALHREFDIPVDTAVKVDTDTLLELSKKVDKGALMLSGFAVIIGFEMVKEGIKHIDFGSMQGKKVKGVEGEVLAHISSEFGDFVIGGVGDNIYYSDFAVIIEPGGDDVYKSRVGGAVGVLGNPFSIVIDMEGDDINSSGKLFNLGGGIFGTGILFDGEGNDTYRCSHYSIGAGLFGVGILIDSCGDDVYEGRYFTQGAGNFGIGMVLDYEGNDTYRAHAYAQGMGGTFGYGFLGEFGGCDLYYSGGRYLDYPLWSDEYNSYSQGFAIGVRPDAGGGIGFLYDKSGNDRYSGGVYCQGTGYWYSLGILVDEGGNDWYNAVEYAQGSGIHLAVGVLIDREGDDHYFSRHGPAQGEGHDLSVGFLIDKKGDDWYSVSGGQGIGLANAIGIFIDSNGNDTYMTSEKEVGQGSGKEARGFPSSGIFLDLRGSDRYVKGSPGEDKIYWVQGKYGAGIDLSDEKVEEEEVTEEEVEEELEGKSIEELWPVACLWEVGRAKKKARKAREILVEKGDEALDYIFPDKMDTKSGLVLRAIRDISDSLQASQRLVKCLRDKRVRVRANAIWVLGEIKDSSAVDSLLSALKNPDNKARWVLRALGKIGDKRVVPDIIPYLGVDEQTDRIYACYALQKLKDERTIESLIGALSDPYFTVRNAAEKAIIEIGDTSLVFLLRSLDLAKDIAKPHIIRAIGGLGEELDTLERKEASDKLLKYLDGEDPTVRGFTVEALGLLGGKGVRDILEAHMEEEKDEFVRARYRFYLTSPSDMIK